MRTFLKLTLLLLFPFALQAQNTVSLKKQGYIAANAVVSGDYKTVVDYMYPKAVNMSGGKAKMVSVLTQTMSQMKAQGITFEKATLGTPGKFYKAGSEIHCLVPESITMKSPNGTMLISSNLLAISADGGKNWSFLDVNKSTIPKLSKLFPKFNPALKIPDPKAPVMQ